MTGSRVGVVLALAAFGLWQLVVVPLLQNEAAGLCDWLARWLVRRAARLLPDKQRARWDEEWRGHLESLPTPLTRLGWAAAILGYAAPRQARLLREGDRRQAERSFPVAELLVALAGISYATWMALEVGGPEVARAVDAIMQTGAPLVASAVCFRAAHRNPSYGYGRAWTASLRRSWSLFGAAALSWGLGQAAWSYFELVAGTDPFPSLADLGFLGSVPLLIAGVLTFPTTPVRALARLRILLDGLLIAGSLLFLAWATILGDAYRSATTSGLEKAFALAYPLGDICAATIALVLLARSGGRGVAQLGRIAAAVFCMVASDSAFAYMTQTGSYGSGALVEVGWLVGWLLLLVAARRPAVAELRGSDEEQPALGGLALPYVPPLLAAFTGLAIQLRTGSLEPFLVVAGTVIGMLVVGRQSIALIENHQLNVHLQATVHQLAAQEQQLKDDLRRQPSHE